MSEEIKEQCECGCENHEHEHHHHHHDHDEECCCGHDHHDHEHHHHHHDNIEMSTHENASIATVKMELGSDRNLAAVLLRSFMRKVAEDAEAAGGMVGHIKFFLKVSSGEMFSMTDPEEVQVKPAEGKSVSAEGVVIVVNIDPDKLHDIVTLHYPTAI